MSLKFDILLVKPRGFCAGVERAIDIVDLALQRMPTPIYVRREIVHNRAVVERFEERGVVFVEELSEVPDGSSCIFSAHGVSPAVWREAEARGLRIIDATCPLVTKVHHEVLRSAEREHTVILIGHSGHDEVLGTMGQAPDQTRLVENVAQVAELEVPEGAQLSYVTQTTLSVDETVDIVAALRARFPAIEGPRKDDICYATQNRQDAVKALVRDHKIDLLLVVGSENSSNSVRLVEVAVDMGAGGRLIENADVIESSWFENIGRVGLSAGASAPEDLVQGVVRRLTELGGALSEVEHAREDVSFPLPAELR